MAEMGMGKLANPDVIFKRKFRWGMTITPKCSNKPIDEYLVKVAARPNLAIEETEINSKNGKMYIPGKASWETITVTFYDIAGSTVNDGIIPLYEWIVGMYDMSSDLNGPLSQGDSVKAYGAVIVLNMYSGCGTPLETWTLKDAWPQSINWNDLDYSSSEEATIEMTIRYANVVFSSDCFKGRGGCCTDCNGNITAFPTPTNSNGAHRGPGV